MPSWSWYRKKDSNVAFSFAHPANVIVKSGSIEFWMCKIGSKKPVVGGRRRIVLRIHLEGIWSVRALA